MRSVTVWIRAAEFSATMAAIGEWLDANRYEPTRYQYDHNQDAVLVTVDFPAEVAAEAFAMRFDGVYLLSPQPTARQVAPVRHVIGKALLGRPEVPLCGSRLRPRPAAGDGGCSYAPVTFR